MGEPLTKDELKTFAKRSPSFGEWPREQFRKHGVNYEPSEKPKSVCANSLGRRFIQRTNIAVAPTRLSDLGSAFGNQCRRTQYQIAKAARRSERLACSGWSMSPVEPGPLTFEAFELLG
jgi:hypothetical protein